MQLLPDKRIVPALMFHSVGLQEHAWLWRQLSESVESFESKIALFKEKRLNPVLWDQLYEAMEGRVRLPGNSIMLTFDDGYLDNWVYAYPILKKYGLKATIFVNPEFVDPNPQPRPTLEDVWAGRCQLQDLQPAGFLSWAEMRQMQASGLIDIQSHALTHTWYFSGPRILDFHAPASLQPYPWLLWNARPERKAFYLTEDQSGFLPWGHPVLEHEKSLVVRRFFPDAQALGLLVEHVKNSGGAAFFGRAGWRQRLLDYARAQLGEAGLPGQFESDASRRARIRHELAESKRIIERELGKPVDYICWPGGGNSEEVQALAAEVGYRAWTLGSRDQSAKRNLPGTGSRSIKRLGTSNGVHLRGRRIGSGGAQYQMLRVLVHQGSALSALLLQAYKLLVMSRLVRQP